LDFNSLVSVGDEGGVVGNERDRMVNKGYETPAADSPS
jgi:hypothetical protein